MNREDAIKMTLEVIKEKKLENSSIGEIVKKMDISPGNLYYHFKSKNELYREVLEYSINEIADSLDKVKLDINKKNNLFQLTEKLIRFLEKREDILFFLITMKGSSYLEKKSNSRDLLLNFKNMLVNQDLNTEHEKRIALKLNMFLGSVYEVLYENKLLKKRNLTSAEINEIYLTFWGNEGKEDSGI